ncbi:hypothetical protein Asp14428_44050 [Actinoplanes sp. NBRC 14428]|uniref:RNA polymerase ECF family sigma subunit n=1 Tax=Pseudosporangium ferrugineum TaxID=439699 RepID=A0A2T0S7E5_9ACTN|nr:sigma-70 family RNA polymerase sigma factor [Pseudosporangium ferrugineum]PRY29347.1 RNA polymerase ECF family sigma subunit [Pseudosporangium ferrugineum]BCJ52930.1 hypothetical protein Asp14428_44050 [Actinoplanes sp. NBRC 14428]
MPTDDEDARERFEALFTDHYPELIRFAGRRVGRDSAADIVAGTFLIAWRRFAEMPADHARAWLYATARHVIANELRSRNRRERLSARLETTEAGWAEDASGPVGEQLRVQRVLAGLSAMDQEVLRLSEWEDLDVAEMAIVLGCTRTAAKVRLHRARRRFAARLLAAEQPVPNQRVTPPVVTRSRSQA